MRLEFFQKSKESINGFGDLKHSAQRLGFSVFAIVEKFNIIIINKQTKGDGFGMILFGKMDRERQIGGNRTERKIKERNTKKYCDYRIVITVL